MDKGNNFSPTVKPKTNVKSSSEEGNLYNILSSEHFKRSEMQDAADGAKEGTCEELQEEVFEPWDTCQSQEIGASIRKDVPVYSSGVCVGRGSSCCSTARASKTSETKKPHYYSQCLFTPRAFATSDSAVKSASAVDPKCRLKSLPLQEVTPMEKYSRQDASYSGCLPKYPAVAKELPSEASPPDWATRGSACEFKRSSLTVPQPLPSSLHLTRSASLNSLKINTPDKVDCRDRAVSVPSSPDSFYCDSMYSSYGTVSVDLNCSSLMRSLSCGALNSQMTQHSSTSTSVTSHRRSNSSDSAVVLPSEEDRSPFLKTCKLFVDLKQHFQPASSTFPLDSPLPDPPKDQMPSLLFGDQCPLPCLNAPFVIVSDHSSQDGISLEPSAEDFPSLDYPSLDFPSLEDSLSGDLGWHSSRKFSDCSTCSLASSLSVEDEELDETQRPCYEEERKSQPSGWRKVRNIVHWSPFVQTYKKQKYPWVQLAGHQGSFKAGGQGTILKKLCPKEERCLLRLMKDDLWPFVPEYKGQIDGDDNEKYLKLQDLLKDFDNPCVMDCKIGVRTYLEEELAKAKEKCKLRKDMFEKMVQVDPLAPTEEENRLKGVTKPRYMVWRETISSTATLGFRIEGMKRGGGVSSKDFKMIRSIDQVGNAVRSFVDGFEQIVPHYLQRLKDLRNALTKSEFFKSHELIGSSLLFVHDSTKASVWMIDFAKTQSLPEKVLIDHNSPWVVGNHEDGYLIGIDNLLHIFSSIGSSHHLANT